MSTTLRDSTKLRSDKLQAEFSFPISGVEKLTRSTLKGVLKKALFAYKTVRLFRKQFSPLRYRTFISLKKQANLSSKFLSKTPLKPDRVSFCTPNYSRCKRNIVAGQGPYVGIRTMQENRHRVNGVGRGGGQTVFNQIPWNPVKIRLKSG